MHAPRAGENRAGKIADTGRHWSARVGTWPLTAEDEPGGVDVRICLVRLCLEGGMAVHENFVP
jgi:hypothetical protein